MNDELFLLANQKKNTNHVLHFLISVVSFGGWVIIWILIANLNSRHNSAIDKKMNSIVEHKVAGETYSEGQDSIRDGDQYKNRVILVVLAVIILIVYLKSR